MRPQPANDDGECVCVCPCVRVYVCLYRVKVISGAAAVGVNEEGKGR